MGIRAGGILLGPAGGEEPPKNWWGGHMWNDKAKRYAYRPSGHLQDAVWYNFNLAKAEELRLYNDLLNPKWKGKIGFFDPRLGGGAGLGMWGFLAGEQKEACLEETCRTKIGSDGPAEDSR